MADEKIKEIPRSQAPESIQERYQPKKEGQSSFDKVLEQNRLLQKSSQPVQVNLIKEGSQEDRVSRRQEHGERGKDKQQDEKEKERTKQKAKEERSPEAQTGQRVMGRGQTKGNSDKGGGKSGHQDRGGYGGGLQQRRKIEELKKGEFAKAAQVATEATKFASQLKDQMRTAHLSREFVQKLVNQIVSFCRAGLNKEGDKEIRLDLNERIFKGLQLRVALKHGKVDVQFGTSSQDVRELFTNSSKDIKKELESKGVLVGEIKVT